MKRDIDATTTPDIYHLSDDAPVLELYATVDFDNTENQRILAGDSQLGNFYRALQCSVVDGVLIVPTFEDVDTTEDSPDNQQATYSAYLRANGQPLIPWLEDFRIPPSTTTPASSISWTTLRIHKSGILQRDPLLTYTRQEILALIEIEVAVAIGTLNDAAVGVKGRAAASFPPTLPTMPIFTGTNDPRVPTQSENDALAGTNGAPSSGNKYVTNSDPRFLLGMLNQRLAISGTYALANADKTKTVALGGAGFYALTVSAASGFDADFMALLLNEDTARGKLVSVNGLTDFYLYPGQSAILYNQNNTWRVFRNNRYRCPSGQTVFVDPAGSATNDGLATGAGGALPTIQAAIDRIKRDFDLSLIGATPVTIQLADGTYTSAGPWTAIVNGPFVGHQPTTQTFPSANEAPLMIKGNAASPGNVIIANSAASTFLCINSWVVLKDLKVTSTVDGIRAAYGGVFIGNIIFGNCGGSWVFSGHEAVIENFDDIFIDGNAGTFGFLADFNASILFTAHTIKLLANITFTIFAVAQRGSDAYFTNTTIDLNGKTATGTRYAVQSGGSITTGTSSETFFPGTIAGFIDGFGSYDNLPILDLPFGALQIRGGGTGNVLLGAWAFSNAYGAVSLNGSLATGSFNLASGPADANFYINRPTGGDIIWRENNGSGPSQMTLKNTTGRLGISVDAPTSGIHILLAKIPVFANNAAAVAGGLTAGAFYRTGADPDPVCIVH